MRTNDGLWTRILGGVVAGVAALAMPAASAQAETTSVSLIAAPVTKSVTLPDGRVLAVPMWGYALDANGNGVLDGTEVVSVPGPRIVVPPTSTRLEITLTNLLPVPTSIVIPGLPFEAMPVRNGDDRVRSMTVETDAYDPESPTAPDHLYVFDPVKPGTFLYQSGSHPAVQVQMGLYGAVTRNQGAGLAYAGVAYSNEAVLVYSEIDPELHEAVENGTYGTEAGPTSTLHYRPSLFLVNGESFSTAAASVAAGTAGQATLLRFLNAGLRTHAPQIANGRLVIWAEDGNKLPFAKDQAEVMLAAGKTHDALWTPAAAGSYSLYDRMLSLNAPGQGEAGMLARLRVLAAGTSTTIYANDDSYGTSEGVALSVPAAGVLANDTGAPTTATIVSLPAHSSAFSLTPNGGFTYTPAPGFFGIDTFTYTASSGSTVSQPATVGIAVQMSQRAPVALAQTIGVTAGESVSVALGGTDANDEPLSFYVAHLPEHAGSGPTGALSYIDPVTKIQTSLTADDLYSQPGKKAIPAGNLIYTPAADYAGPETFTFVASDGTLASAPAVISAAVRAPEADEDAELTNTVTLSVRGADGATISDYRWTLEEDLTFKVTPGVPYPDGDSSKLPLSVSFHKSYMPVRGAGCAGEGCPAPTQPKVNPLKRYFVSVLPTASGQYSNGGTEIEAGASSATVTVSKLPLPTARIRVRVFQDNAPLNGMWDSTEPGLAGFQVTIDDAGGTYGMSGGHQSTDAFGNKIGTKYQPCPEEPCDGYSVASLGDGFVLTDADGYALIENLVMGKYTVKVRAPGGQQWIQTSTIEGTPGIDAWVKPNEPQFFTEFGPPGPHVEVGFTRLTNTLPRNGGFTVSGRVTNLRQSRPPEVAQSSGAPFDATKHTRTWVALNSGATGGNLLYAQPTNEDGTFQIAHVPNGSYQLVVFDKALDLIIGNAVVDVAGAAKNVGDVAVFDWFTTLYAYVFEDKNGDGIHQNGEPGIADQALNIRFRDGSIYQSLSSGENGFKAFYEVFPFFAWMVAEVDYTRFHSTGVTVVVDAGGDSRAGASNAYNWQQQAGLPSGLIPPEVLNPQLQPENGNKPFRTESGAETPFLLLEGFQGFIGQSTVMLWGKAPYAKPGSKGEDINVAPFDEFPVGGDVDANGDGKFNTDHYNGGIAGIIHYGITRAENDPRWAAAENWEPGVSDVRVQLWDENRTHLLNEVTTDNWNNSLPEGCQWPNDAPFVYEGKPTDCFDGLRNFNQARPALFDGGYAFSTILQDAPGSATYDLPIDQRQVARPIPAGRYVVKIIVPPGYQLQKEEDKNVDFGDTYIPQQFWLSGYPLADGGGPGDAQPAPTVTDNALIAPFCVGQLHVVPETLSIFPGEQKGAFAGEMRPLCDAKLVVLRDGQQAAPDFHLFTEAPVAGHVYGMVLDDTTNEFDPNKPTFGEKFAVPYVGVSFRDWQGREITRTYSDQFGMYNALVPTTYTINPPEPSGVSPSLLSACINPPTMPGPGGTEVPDPHFQKQYSHFCYPLQYLPGKTTYLDTPVLPTGAFTGNGTLPVDAELPTGTPVIASVSGPGDSGPYIVDNGAADNAARTIVISSAASLTDDGLTEVPNPAWDGSGAQPKLIKRDYGFGAGGTVYLGDTPLPAANVTWGNAQITAIVPTSLRTGQLSVARGTGAAARRSVLGVTLSVATPQMHALRPPVFVGSGTSIQAAIDAARPGDLILVRPGVHEEMVVMTKPVRLQGFGALSTAINVVTTPAENIQAWLDKMGNLLLSNPNYLLPNQPAMTPAPFQPGDVSAVVGDEGPGVMVMSRNLNLDSGGHCLGSFAAPTNEAYCLHNENYSSAPLLTITAMSATTGILRTVTVTTSQPHGFTVGALVTIAGVNQGVYNGAKLVTAVPSSTQFRYLVLTSPATPAPTFSSATAQGSVPQSPLWKPNARIDGLSLIGASNAPGVLVNGYAHYLELSNNRIYTNSGTYAGGIQLGHPAAAAPFNDEDAQNDHVSIHNNMVTQNAANEIGGGGGIVLGTGSTNYVVRGNYIAANLTAGNGGGIAHVGRSEVGVIDANTIVFNESFFQATGTNGGGIFIGGTPAAAGASTVGSGQVDVTNNLIQGNSAAGGDGGGVALLGFASSDRIHLYNNVIANNVAGLAGGGISIAGVPGGNPNNPIVDITHNTIVDNDSTGTAGAAFASPLSSTPQPGGIAGRGAVSRVRIANSIIWHNRTFYFGACTPPPGGRCGILPVGASDPTQYAEIQITTRPYWDLANLSGDQFAPIASVLSSLSGPSSSANYLSGTNDTSYGANNNTAAAPAFVSSYFNADRRYAYQVGETTGEATLISVPAALDEGGNFIRPQFGPLSLESAPSTYFGNYHLTAGVDGRALCGSNSLFGGSCGLTLPQVPDALESDFDKQPRASGAPDRGADENVAPVPTTPVPQR
jgi:hypothetical protein